MHTGQSFPVLENVFHITFVKNPGAAFGLLAHQTTFFIIVALLVTGVIVYFNFTLPQEKQLLRTGLALQLGGAVGNSIDRVQTGYVIDFFDFRIWPVFNIADIAIVVGVSIIIWEILWEDRKNISDKEYNK